MITVGGLFRESYFSKQDRSSHAMDELKKGCVNKMKREEWELLKKKNNYGANKMNELMFCEILINCL